MNIREKIKMDRESFLENGAITIVIFGDSVSYGAFGIDEVDYEAVYWNRLRDKIYDIRRDIPINVINSAIGATTASSSLGRMEKQVFAHNPDLLIVAFGLNDVNDGLEEYLSALKQIFERAKKAGIDTVFLTPNMLNTYVADDTRADLREYAAVTAEFQCGGRMDTEDTTMLLANRINHPTREMHELFAQSLFNLIFPGVEKMTEAQIDSMWRVKERV